MQEPRKAGSEKERRSEARQRPPARLKKRADFLRAAKGQRAQARAFSLQAIRRKDEAEAGPPRFGFTVTKKLGGAVLRNRIRRRLKEAVRLAPGLSARPGFDYVVVGRQAALDQDFTALQEDLARAITEVHARAPTPRHPAPRMSRRASVCATATKMKD